MPSEPEVTVTSPSLSEAIEAVWSHHLAALDEAFDESIRGLQNLLRLDDYHRRGHEEPQLAQSLGPFGSSHLDLASLSKVLGKAASARCLPEDRLNRVNRLLEALQEWRQALGSLPDAFPAAAISEDEAVIHEKAAAHLNRMAEAFRDLRIAQLEIRSKYDPTVHGAVFRDFDWRQLSRAELRLCPPFIIHAALESGSGRELQPILSLLESRKPFKIVASRSTLRKRYTATSDPSVPANLAVEMLPLALRGVYFLQTSVVAADFRERVFAALTSPRPGLLSILVPHAGEGHDAFRSRAAGALKARAFPAVVYDPNAAPGFVACFDLSGNPSAEEALPFAEFAAAEPEFAGEFSGPPPDASPHDLVAVTDYLALSRRQRIGKYPCVFAADSGSARVVSPDLLAQTSDQTHLWRTLQELAGVNNPFVAATTAALETERDKREQAALAALRKELEEAQAGREQAAVADAVRRIVARFTGVDPGEIRLQTETAPDA